MIVFNSDVDKQRYGVAKKYYKNQKKDRLRIQDTYFDDPDTLEVLVDFKDYLIGRYREDMARINRNDR